MDRRPQPIKRKKTSLLMVPLRWAMMILSQPATITLRTNSQYVLIGRIHPSTSQTQTTIRQKYVIRLQQQVFTTKTGWNGAVTELRRISASTMPSDGHVRHIAYASEKRLGRQTSGRFQQQDYKRVLLLIISIP